ncbi:hypothetical protein M885DRAFT_580716 [Pelagophyceae sp. CCMP2097]|nr:hypothetical protein M885DRAFT_580716 [Pelagophyceae sp. CCMP2097]
MANSSVVPQAGLTANVLAARQFSELRVAGEAQVQYAEVQAPQMGLAGAVKAELEESSRPAPPVPPVAEYDPTDMAGRKESLTAVEADAVREMMKTGVGQAAAATSVIPVRALAPGMVHVKAVFDFVEVQQATDAVAFAAAGESGSWINGEINGNGRVPAEHGDIGKVPAAVLAAPEDSP